MRLKNLTYIKILNFFLTVSSGIMYFFEILNTENYLLKRVLNCFFSLPGYKALKITLNKPFSSFFNLLIFC